MSTFKKLQWRTFAEFIGVASIVGSLIFVGMEVRQAERSAQNERRFVRADSNLALREAINSHADTWLKGIRGEQLSENESLVFGNLFQAYWSRTNTLVSTRLDDGSLDQNFAVNEFSWFLYKNPGARKGWIELMEEQDHFMSFLSSNPDQVNDIQAQVLRNLERLDSDESQ